ncbi:LysR family transcriptional regulator [Morganella morganii]|uniref:LysR family transcriptional regulator n=1 Tax=Morganella morganii TaxID=582 RepID=UPI0034E51B31
MKRLAITVKTDYAENRFFFRYYRLCGRRSERQFYGGSRQTGDHKISAGKRISQLEAAPGVSLFQRGNRRITLTPAGERYLTRCLSALAIPGGAEDEISEQQTTLSGRLRIDLPGAFGRRRMIPAPSATAKNRTTRRPDKSE